MYCFKKCFGQKESLIEIVRRECLNDVREISARHATPRGLRVVNYYALIVGIAP